MALDNPQFDILLGGVEELPQDLTVMRYASNRAQEILSLTEALQEPKKTGLVFQRLPRHMRRRVMSHNAKRMPRQLREAHISQMEKSGLPPKSKRPSRKYRRRPSNLLDAYNRRKKENIWLETHIWHAKRFHMTNKWGYRLANFPNDKSKRACYRAAANHCLIQDISYYKCIELSGTLECIIHGLKSLTRDECGRTFSAKTWLNGGREGSVTLFYSSNTYPCGAIGQVLFMWKPLVTTSVESSQPPSQAMETDFSVFQKKRTIWIWIHPSYFKEVKEEIIKVFEMESRSSVSFQKKGLEPMMKKVKLGNLISESESIDEQPNLEVSADMETELFSHPGPHCEGKGVEMTLLEDKLVRLRLTGPLSQAVLRETFVLAPDALENREGISWMTQWENVLKCQRKVWQMISGFTSPAMLSPHLVMGLTILDPRCNLPGKRTKAVDQDTSESDLTQGTLPLEVSTSPIWDPKIRDYATNSKPEDVEINQRQSANLVPGLMDFDEDSISGKNGDGIHSRVPILLIQRPGNQDSDIKRLGYCCGWDVIAPAGWGKPLWMAFVLRGARAGGLREIEMVEDVAFTHSLCWPPLPDTNAARIEAKQREEVEKEKYFKLPPNKRPNYVKLGISSPFSHPWDILCHEWSNSASMLGTENPFYVLRDNIKLRKISEILDSIKGAKNSRAGNLGDVEGSKNPNEFFKKLIVEIDGINDHCLTPVRIIVSKKGTINNFAVICIPSEDDFFKDSKGCSQFRGVEEPSNEDENENDRKKMRKEHKQTLARLRRKRVKQRKESELCTEQKTNEESARPVMGKAATAELCKEYKEKVEGLVLPACTQVRKSCSREVAGYVTSGCFSFCDAKEIGMAFMTLPALQHLVNTKSWNPQLIVLVRNRHSKHYISAEIEIITS